MASRNVVTLKTKKPASPFENLLLETLDKARRGDMTYLSIIAISGGSLDQRTISFSTKRKT